MQSFTGKLEEGATITEQICACKQLMNTVNISK